MRLYGFSFNKEVCRLNMGYFQSRLQLATPMCSLYMGHDVLFVIARGEIMGNEGKLLLGDNDLLSLRMLWLMTSKTMVQVKSCA
jgi:hypothetical protein